MIEEAAVSTSARSAGQLRMTVEERVRHMVEVANVLMEIRATARFV